MWLIVFLILLGVLFLVAELVLLPGISLGALFALICYGSAIYTAFTDYGPFAGGVVVLVIAALSFVGHSVPRCVRRRGSVSRSSRGSSRRACLCRPTR